MNEDLLRELHKSFGTGSTTEPPRDDMDIGELISNWEHNNRALETKRKASK